MPMEMPLSTSGRFVVDAHGRRVRLTGVNWYGAHEDLGVAPGLDRIHRGKLAQTIAWHGFNSVRLPPRTGPGGRGPRAEEAVAQPYGPPQRGFAGPAEPQRREGLLERLGLHRGVLELPELAVEGDPGLGPQRLHQRDSLTR
jgi:hypothetical protein